MIEVNEQILNEINEHFIIPPKPQILSELQELAGDEHATLGDVAGLVAKDIAIASAILKIINSPAYGLARTVSDIKQGVMFLGWDGVKALIQGIKLKQAFIEEQCCISLERFWDTSTDIANVIMFVGQRVKSQVPVENLYALGLFHDCGIPPMAIKYDNYVQALKVANQRPKASFTDIEEKLYVTNHAVVGYYLASSWNLPKDICQLILNHHDLSILKSINSSNEQISFAALKVAEHLVNLERRGTPSNDWPAIENVALDVLGMHEDDFKDLQEDVADYLYVH